MRSSIDVPWRSKAGGLVGNGCVGEYHSPGTSPFATGPLVDRPDRLTVGAIEHVEQRLLRRLGDRLDGAAVDGDVGEDRRRRHVEVPDPMVHELVMPLALAGRQIDGHQRLAEQVGARPVAAVVVAGGQLDRQIRHVEILIDRHLSPHAGVARVLPRVLLPRVVAEFTDRRDGVEDPQALAGADVEAADEALHVGLAARDAAGPMRGADDDHVPRHERRRMQPDLAGDRIDLLVVVLLQIDDAVLAEGRDRHAGLRVEREEAVAGRDVENPLLAAVGPVRQATAREDARCVGAARAFILAVHPQQFARGRIERDHRAARAGRGIHDPVRHQRRRLEIELGAAGPGSRS